MPDKTTLAQLLQTIADLAQQGQNTFTSTQLTKLTGASLATVKRLLDQLNHEGKVARQGKARATRYELLPAGALALPTQAANQSTSQSTPQATSQPAPQDTPPPAGIAWSEESRALRQRLDTPLAARDPVTYQRDFVDRYEPNQSWLLPQRLAEELAQAGRMQGQQPAGTYARKVLEQLLIDLSWSSSRLEGNRYSLLATEELFRSGISSGDIDTVMLLNHKSAIEFLVDAVPSQGLSAGVVRNLHAVLMQDLLADTDALGAIRNKIVNISDTVYVPTQVPSILQEMLQTLIDKARRVRNAPEAAFFLWINLAYLQPFEDGNKRTGRLAANIPLMLYNCAPLSFLDVDPQDYAMAMMGVYEFRDVSMAADLFEWTYRRSLKKYAVVLESMGAPDPDRLRYRESLNAAIGLIVRDRQTVQASLVELDLTEDTAPGFRALLVDELQKLEPFNCARYRIAMSSAEAWIAAGRPQ